MASIVRNLVEIAGITDPATLSGVDLSNRMFKQLTLQETLDLPEAKPDIEQLVKVVAQAVITSTKVITTPSGVTSLEGQTLLGKKLIIEGEIIQKIEYVADECTQSVHATHFNIPFSIFIVVPPNFPFAPFKVVPYIEDIFVCLIDKRTIFKNVTLLINVEL